MCVDAPSTKGQERLAASNEAIAREQLDLARDEASNARTRQARFDPLYEQLITRAMDSQASNDARADEQWALYRELGLPAERRLAEAAATYDTPERRAAEAEAAVTGVDRQFEAQRDAQRRTLSRMGSSVSGNRALTLDAASRFANAKASAGADRAARQRVEATGLSLSDAVAARGRGMTTTGLQASQLALAGGGQAGGQLGQQQGTYNASLAPAQSYYNGAVGGNQAAGSIYNSIAQIQQSANDGAMGGLLGLGKLGAMYAISDPKTKNVHGEVDGKKAVLTLSNAKVYDWTYRKGHGDGKRHIGRMAGEADADTPAGKAIDVISEIGLHHAAIAQVAKDVAAIKRRLSLSDVSDAKIRRVA